MIKKRIKYRILHICHCFLIVNGISPVEVVINLSYEPLSLNLTKTIGTHGRKLECNKNIWPKLIKEANNEISNFVEEQVTKLEFDLTTKTRGSRGVIAVSVASAATTAFASSCCQPVPAACGC